jgi:hypothetical protein
VPIAIERSASPPIFSRRHITASTRAGSMLPVSSSSAAGSARRMRGMKRSRIWAPQA